MVKRWRNDGVEWSGFGGAIRDRNWVGVGWMGGIIDEWLAGWVVEMRPPACPNEWMEWIGHSTHSQSISQSVTTRVCLIDCRWLVVVVGSGRVGSFRFVFSLLPCLRSRCSIYWLAATSCWWSPPPPPLECVDRQPRRPTNNIGNLHDEKIGRSMGRNNGRQQRMPPQNGCRLEDGRYSSIQSSFCGVTYFYLRIFSMLKLPIKLYFLINWIVADQLIDWLWRNFEIGRNNQKKREKIMCLLAWQQRKMNKQLVGSTILELFIPFQCQYAECIFSKSKNEYICKW